MGKASACHVGVIGVTVRFPGQEEPLEEGTATHSSILAWKISWSEEAGRGHMCPWEHKESDMTEATEHTRMHTQKLSILNCACPFIHISP